MSSTSGWMRIGDVARETDTSADTIRYYERIGLLPPGERTDNNYRGYSAHAVQRLRFIRRCRQLDMSVAEISQILEVKDDPSAPCGPAVAVMQEHLRHVKERLAELRQLQRELSALLQTCSGGSSASCEVLGALDARPNLLGQRRLKRQSMEHLGGHS
jgi:Cd(II)/Pb(II)-responsive transcriptional regulator